MKYTGIYVSEMENLFFSFFLGPQRTSRQVRDETTIFSNIHFGAEEWLLLLSMMMMFLQIKKPSNLTKVVRTGWNFQKQQRKSLIFSQARLPVILPWLLFTWLNKTLCRLVLLSRFHIFLFPSLEQQANPPSCLIRDISTQCKALQTQIFSPVVLSKTSSQQKEGSPHKSFIYTSLLINISTFHFVGLAEQRFP